MKKMQCRYGRIVLFGVFFLLLGGVLFREQLYAALPLDKIKGYAALINGEPILLSDIENAVLKQDTLEHLILQKLFLQQAAKLGISVKDNELGLALEQANISANETFTLLGYSPSKEHLRAQLLIAKYLNKTVLTNVTVSPEEEKEYYDNNSQEFVLPESVHVAHILIKLNGKTSLELDETLQQIIDKIKKGISFDELAKQYSEDSFSAPLGGNLGYIYKGQTVPEFDKFVFTTPVNGTSPTFKTTYGFHILKVYDKRSSRPLSYFEVKGKLQRMLLMQKQNKAILSHANQLRKQAVIKIYLHGK